MVLKLNELRTGMKVQTSEGRFFYVIEDWCHRKAGDTTSMNAILLACDPADTQRFYGLLNYDEHGHLFGLDEHAWNIEKVYIFTGDLNDMNLPDHEAEWVEITEPIVMDQETLTKYLNKFV